MTKLYIDTNILIYAIEDSLNPFGKDISTSSSKLFGEAASCKYQVIISTWALSEVRRIRNIDDLDMLLKIVEKKIIIQKYTKEDVEQAKRQNSDHFQDELHGMLALRAGAD